MFSTFLMLVLFIALMVTLWVNQNLSASLKEVKLVQTADRTNYQVALEGHLSDIRSYRTVLADSRRAHETALKDNDSLIVDREVHEGRIKNLCEQLDEARKARRHYYDIAASRANTIIAQDMDIKTLRATLRGTQEQLQVAKDTIADLTLPNSANLSDLRNLSDTQQADKLDALCEVIKTLMARDELGSSLVASFGGRLSRAVQVYRKERAEAGKYALEESPCLIPGLQHLMGL